MTPPSVPKVCRECDQRARAPPPYDIVGGSCWAPTERCAALELLKTISAPDPEECTEECPLAERLRKEME